MALVSPSPPLQGGTTSHVTEVGPCTLLCWLMLNASAHSMSPPCTASHHGGASACSINHTTYCISQQTHEPTYHGALVNSGANGGMAGLDTHILATIPCVHIDITGVGGQVMECLLLVQCASVVDIADEGHIIVITSQYAHKPDAKTICSKSQLEHFVCVVYNSASAADGKQMILTHEGYVIPLQV